MAKIQNLKQIRMLIYVCAFVFLFGFIKNAFAAELFFKTEQERYHLGDTFIADIQVNTEGQYINTIQATIQWPTEMLELINFNLGNSILTLQPEKASINKEQGLAFFVGGVPGGYFGTRGLVARAAFRALKEGEGKLKFLDDAIILLNDGLGTKAKVKVKEVNIIVLFGKPELARDQWGQEMDADKILPELFKPQIAQDPNIFEGKYSLVFSTVDKQTGVDYYEVKEGGGDWVRAESPYLLIDQSRQSVIQVRAVDKAGNERIETIPLVQAEEKIQPEEKKEEAVKINRLLSKIYKYKIKIAIAILIIILVIVVISLFCRKKKQNKDVLSDIDLRK